MDQYGISSLGIIYYSSKCAEQLYGITIEPLGQDYNDDLENQRGYLAPVEEELTWWERFQQDEYYELYKWTAIITVVALMSVAICVICRIFCLRRVKVDPRGLSDYDLKNPAGSIIITKELEEKIKERKERKESEKKEKSLSERAGHSSLIDIDDEYGYQDYDDEGGSAR